jgi:hypothetical protein
MSQYEEEPSPDLGLAALFLAFVGVLMLCAAAFERLRRYAPRTISPPIASATPRRFRDRRNKKQPAPPVALIEHGPPAPGSY